MLRDSHTTSAAAVLTFLAYCAAHAGCLAALQEAAVLGMPDEARGEVVAALVTIKPGVTGGNCAAAGNGAASSNGAAGEGSASGGWCSLPGNRGMVHEMRQPASMAPAAHLLQNAATPARRRHTHPHRAMHS